jgi:hypothetical protein
MCRGFFYYISSVYIGISISVIILFFTKDYACECHIFLKRKRRQTKENGDIDGVFQLSLSNKRQQVSDINRS